MIKANIVESVVDVWDRSMQLKIVLQESDLQSKNVHEVISGEIVPNDLFLGEISIENAHSIKYEIGCVG